MKISPKSGKFLIKYYETAIKQNFLDIRKHTSYFLETLHRTLNNINEFSSVNPHPSGSRSQPEEKSHNLIILFFNGFRNAVSP